MAYMGKEVRGLSFEPGYFLASQKGVIRKTRQFNPNDEGGAIGQIVTETKNGRKFVRV